jgi:hypothetical protein
VKFNEIFSRFKDDQDVDFINVNRLTEVLQAFGRNPSLRDSEDRINELEMAGKKIFLRTSVLQTGRVPGKIRRVGSGTGSKKNSVRVRI